MKRTHITMPQEDFDDLKRRFGTFANGLRMVMRMYRILTSSGANEAAARKAFENKVRGGMDLEDAVMVIIFRGDRDE